MRTQEELRLYKDQLDLAQREIFRAQEVVEGVERERRDAEERSGRDRERVRRLVGEREVQRALDEGRREGYRQGWDRGRRLALEEARAGTGRYARRREADGYYEDDEDDEDDDRERYDDPPSRQVSPRIQRASPSPPLKCVVSYSNPS